MQEYELGLKSTYVYISVRRRKLGSKQPRKNCLLEKTKCYVLIFIRNPLGLNSKIKIVTEGKHILLTIKITDNDPKSFKVIGN